MSDDRISLDFLGEQMLRMQADLRGVRSEQVKLESEQTSMRADLKRLETKIDNLASSVEVRFEQANRTAAINLEVVLNALKAER